MFKLPEKCSMVERVKSFIDLDILINSNPVTLPLSMDS